MKLNKKGTTLVELIISIVLISVVLGFMFRLLIDLDNEQNNNTFAVDNQIKRAEIIKFIENDITNKKLSLVNASGSNGATLVINFNFKDGTNGKITATASYLEYKNSKNETRHWAMQNCTLYTTRALVTLNKDTNIYAMDINIEIHTANDLNSTTNNNHVDDISLSYVGNVSDYNPTLTCLGIGC